MQMVTRVCRLGIAIYSVLLVLFSIPLSAQAYKIQYATSLGLNVDLIAGRVHPFEKQYGVFLLAQSQSAKHQKVFFVWLGRRWQNSSAQKKPVQPHEPLRRLVERMEVSTAGVAKVGAGELKHAPSDFISRPPDITQNIGPIHVVLAVVFILLSAYIVWLKIQLARVRKHGVTRENQYRELIDGQPVALCCINSGGIIRFANQAFCNLFSINRDNISGALFASIFQDVHEDTLSSHQQSAFNGQENCRFEIELKQTCSVRWFQFILYPIVDRQNQIYEVQAIAQDITDRKRAEEADKNLAHALRLAVAGELTAMVAHEVSQPLGAIMANAEAGQILLKLGDAPTDEVNNIFTDIRDSVIRANSAVRRMRALMSRHELNMQSLNLNDTVVLTLKLVEGDVIKRKINLQRSLGENLPLVNADQVFIQQVLLNLLVNAMDAMEATPSEQRVMVVETCSAVNQMVCVKVTDSGAGITAENIQSIFSSFYSTKKGGMGLGLAICRSIIETHSGQIWAENNSKSGTTVQFTLKAA